VIAVSHLKKTFNGFTAVDDISFSVREGETLVLLGTSGSGKTTTLKMINRLIEPTSGSIRIEGEEVRKQDPVELRKRIGYVIQEIGLFPHYTVGENIAVVPELLHWDEPRIQRRQRELMELVGLSPEEYLGRMPHELSGGQQQRVGLIRALAADPPIVLLDEPFGALDPITRMDIRAEFKRLEHFLEKTMILVTHDVLEAFELGDVICLMDSGRIQQLGTPKELLFAPATNFVRDFLKGTRLQLELQTLTLRDIAPQIKPMDISPDQTFEFAGETSLYEVLETVEHAEAGQPAVRISEQSTAGHKFSPQAILQAFYSVRDTIEL